MYDNRINLSGIRAKLLISTGWFGVNSDEILEFKFGWPLFNSQA
jgi:hypothetical protein